MKMKTLLAMVAAVIIAFGAGMILTKLITEQVQPEVYETIESKQSAETDLISDPIYGDDLTKEELKILKEEDASEAGVGMMIGEEFTIELGETQGTGGF